MTTVDDINDTLRAHVRLVSDALWELDSARSLRRKAESGGSRSSERTGDQKWDSAQYQQREARAVLAAARLLRTLGLAGEVPPSSAEADALVTLAPDTDALCGGSSISGHWDAPKREPGHV